MFQAVSYTPGSTLEAAVACLPSSMHAFTYIHSSIQCHSSTRAEAGHPTSQWSMQRYLCFLPHSKADVAVPATHAYSCQSL